MLLQLKYFPIVIFQFSLILVCFSQTYVGDKCRDASGRNGTCVLFKDCSYARDNLEKGIIPVNCGFKRNDPIVCCPIIKPGDIAYYKCRQYLESCPEIYAIVGGVRVIPREYPHMAAIGYGDENSISWNCGGSLISEKFVLTAAHCLNSRETGQARWVLLGTDMLINTTSSDSKNGQIHPVIKRIRHPQYKPPSKYNDIALLEIGAAVTANPLPLDAEKLHPVCFPYIGRKYTNFNAYATGWGRIGFAEDGSSDLLKVDLDIFNTSICNMAYEVEIKSTNMLQRGIDSTMLCAGNLQGGKDTCQGDSGGPLQVSKRLQCMYELWGITSFGKICAAKNSPSVYTLVEAFIPWIESIVWPL